MAHPAPEAQTLRARLSLWLERSARGERMHPLRDARPCAQNAPRSQTEVAVGGLTLGGSGKTPLVAAIALHFERANRPAVVIAHGYHGRSRRAAWVHPNDDPREVGDEARMLAEQLGPSRVALIDRRTPAREQLGISSDAILLFDGGGVRTPRPFRLLALSADSPFGSGRVFPFGDLRRDFRARERQSDAIAILGSRDELRTAAPEVRELLEREHAHEVVRTLVLRTGHGHPVEAENLRDVRLGLVTAVARSRRVLRTITPLSVARHVVYPDHGPLELPNDRSVDRWILTSKCAVWLKAADRDRAIVIHEDLALPTTLISHLERSLAQRHVGDRSSAI